MKDCKVVAFYLPQFHTIPENDEWWGKGFTEWTNVKKAIPLFEGHYQPRVPLNKNYYDLSNIENMKWQVDIAQKHGIYGFCFYHYWFSEKPLLEKPLLNFLNHNEINMPFCLCWANESWTNAWAKPDNTILIEQKYGEKEEWKRHFNFLLPFFKDSRYIVEENKPLIVIYRPYLFDKMIEMLDYWNELSKTNGFDGIKVASQRFEKPEKSKVLFDYLDYHIEYQPNRCFEEIQKQSFIMKGLVSFQDYILKTFNLDLSFRKKKGKLIKYSFDDLWEQILKEKPISEKAIAGAFVGFDNTPRYKYRGRIVINSTPEKFKYFFSKQIEHIEKEYNNDFIFVFAWNEWGEGGYLEPDEKNGFAYLEAIKESLE